MLPSANSSSSSSPLPYSPAGAKAAPCYEQVTEKGGDCQQQGRERGAIKADYSGALPWEGGEGEEGGKEEAERKYVRCLAKGGRGRRWWRYKRKRVVVV